MSEPIIGIDLGTTHTVVAVYHQGSIVVIPNAVGQPLTPSVVRFAPHGRIVVGEAALRGSELAFDTTVLSAKRLIGRRGGQDGGILPESTPLSTSPDGFVVLDIAGQSVSPVEVAAALLLEARLAAETYLGQEVRKAVVTVPARFDTQSRQATCKAAELAGLHVMRIISEPTAAALARCTSGNGCVRGTVAVVHSGGGSFDVAVVELGDGVVHVRATHGDPSLGGDDFDSAIACWLAEEFVLRHGIDLRRDRQAFMRLLRAAERGKRDLSTSAETLFDLPFIASAPHGTPLHLRETLSREALDRLVEPLASRCAAVVEKTLQDAALDPAKIDEVVAVGGGSLMPQIQHVIRASFADGVHLAMEDPWLAVARGAAAQAAVLAGQLTDLLLLDLTSHALGFAIDRGRTQIVIPRNTTFPTTQCVTATTTEDDQTAIAVDVLQGERLRAEGNLKIGHFVLDSIPPAPAGKPTIEITFDIDCNGMVSVQIRDLGTLRTVRGHCGLNAARFGVEEERRTAFHRHMARCSSRQRVAELCDRLNGILGLHRETLSEQAVAEAAGMQALLTQDNAPDAASLDDMEVTLGALERAARVHDRMTQWVHSDHVLPAETGPWRWLTSDNDRVRLHQTLTHLASDMEQIIRTLRDDVPPGIAPQSATIREMRRIGAALEAFSAVDLEKWRQVPDAARSTQLDDFDHVLAARVAWERLVAGGISDAVPAGVAQRDLLAARDDLATHGRSWWARLLPAYRSASRRACRLVPGLAHAGHARRLAVLDAMAARVAFEDAVARVSPKARTVFGALWGGTASDWHLIALVLRAWRSLNAVGLAPTDVRNAIEADTRGSRELTAAYQMNVRAAERVVTFLEEINLPPKAVSGKTEHWDDVDLDDLRTCLAAWRDAKESPADWRAFDDVRDACGEECFASAVGRQRVLATLGRVRPLADVAEPRFRALLQRLHSDACSESSEL